MAPDVSPHPPRRLSARGAALLVVLSCLVAFANSFAGRFVFDDIPEIEQNPSIRSLLPPWDAMFVGHKMPARPLPYLTFAINFFLGGTNPVGYHAVNLLIHVIAALALFDLARSTLASPRLRHRFRQRAVPIALVIAVIWAVHPLQTQAVTYVYQRIESMAGMFVLVSLACFARAAFRGWKPVWLVASIAAAAGGMASKESAVVIPPLILAYDWCYVAEKPGDLRGRGRFYAALAATWLVLGLQLAVQGSRYQEFRDPPHAPLAYALTQGEVILHYLRLVVWPAGQCIDYRWPIQQSWGSIVPAVASVLAAACLTAYGLWKRLTWAWPAALFFLALAPTSSILPVEAVASEHRMYVPLAGVVAIGVLAVVTLFENRMGGGLHPAARPLWGGPVLAGALILALMFATHLRNRMYHNRWRMWISVLERDPTNCGANYNLAGLSLAIGKPDMAMAFAEQAVAKDPSANVFSDLFRDRNAAGDFVTAEQHARRALAVATKVLGAEHRETLEATADLIVALRNRGDAEADSLAAGSIGGMRRVLGADHDATLLVATGIAAAAVESGNAAEGERLAREVLATIGDAPGSRPQIRGLATAVLADAIDSQGRHAEAERVRRPLAASRPETTPSGARTSRHASP